MAERTIYAKAEARADKANAVAVSISHDKHRKKVAVNYYPAESQDGGTVILHITSGHYTYGEDMGRLNNKRLDALYEQAKREIEAKSGPAYDALKAGAEKVKMTLAS